jgi:dihydrofolate reductase
MRRLIVFNMQSLDGYFVDLKGDMSWARNAGPDGEWDEFAASNAQGGGLLVFGRITNELMAGYWPTALAMENNPIVARRMNELPKLVFSRSMASAQWKNTTLVRENPVGEIRRLKGEAGPDLVLMGSGSLVSQLSRARLVDEYQLVVIPILLGGGRTMFEGVEDKRLFKLAKSRVFTNGNVLLCYEPRA